VLSAGFGIVLLGLAALGLLAGPRAPVIGWVGVQSLLILAVYVFAMRTIFVFERTRMSQLAEELTGDIRYSAITLRRAISLYAAVALVLVAAAAYLPGIGEALAEHTGLGQSFVGSLFIAGSTSMPEIVVSAAAVRMGAFDMAAANLFGSNLFNMAVLGVDDLLYTQGSVLAAVAPVHIVTIVAAMMMTGVAIIGVTFRAQRKRYRLSWDALGIVALYLIAVVLLRQLG
jgi:cation:H+ antiporter